MNLNFNEYKDKVYACWIGKNIGGSVLHYLRYYSTCNHRGNIGFEMKNNI